MGVDSREEELQVPWVASNEGIVVLPSRQRQSSIQAMTQPTPAQVQQGCCIMCLQLMPWNQHICIIHSDYRSVTRIREGSDAQQFTMSDHSVHHLIYCSHRQEVLLEAVAGAITIGFNCVLFQRRCFIVKSLFLKLIFASLSSRRREPFINTVNKCHFSFS